jgi:hypothetical protein
LVSGSFLIDDSIQMVSPGLKDRMAKNGMTSFLKAFNKRTGTLIK